MYRQMTVTNFSFNNIKMLTKTFLISNQNTAICLRNYSNVVNEYKRGYFINRHKTNLRFSSSQHVNTEIANETKTHKKKYKYGKYVELLQVGLTTKQIKAKVKSLKSKKLSEFIEKSDYLKNRESGRFLVSQLNSEEMKELKAARKKKKDNLLKLTTASCEKFLDSPKKHVQPVEYQKFDIDMFESGAFPAGECDSKPLIFFRKGNANINDEHKEHIISSFENLKDMIENIKYEEEEEVNLDLQIQKDLTQSEILDVVESESVPLLQSESINSKNSNKSLNKNEKFNARYHKSLEQEKLAKYNSILINLSTYINICVSNGMLSRAFSTLLFYRERCKKLEICDQKKSIPIDFFNILMHGYAKKGELNKIENLLQILNEDGVEINHQTFASIFECIGRLDKSNDNNILITKYSDKAKEKGFSINDIVDKSNFQYDELEIVLDAIRRIDHNFKPIFTPPNMQYSNVLLNSLNNKRENHNLGSENPNSSITYNYSNEELHKFAKEQLSAELGGIINIKSIEASQDFPNSEQYRKKYDDLNALWKSQICAAISRDLNALKAQARHKPNGLMTYYVYLKTLDSRQLADILLQEIKKLAEGSESFSPTVGQLYKELGQKVQTKYHIESKKQNGVLEKTGNIYREYCESVRNRNGDSNTRQIWQKLIHENRSWGPSMNINETPWPNNVLINVGKFLYNILIRDIKIDSNILKNNVTAQKKNLFPAFYTLYRNHGRLVKEEIKPHPILSRLLRVSKQKNLTFNANQIPMLCPPQPWSTPVNGGYLLSKSDLIRLPHQAIQQLARINEMPNENIYPALDSLNQLSSIPWRVNTDILDVILEVFQNGGDHKLDVPESPNSLPPLPSIPQKSSKLTNNERAQMFKQKMARRRKQAEMYSLWCDTLYRLSLANHYRDRVFWLPHNMDFRGRVYPIPPHLNHLGSDLARSILVFDKKRPLGPDGLMWLKLHCINLTGLKKRESVRERILYAEQIMDEILDSANNPLNGGKWWSKSDEPWQTLACCMEIAKVLKSPNPEEYMSGFPIHQDGSCNGLQHYAALGRDVAGAYSVNLSPSDSPQDVYSAIATLVEKARQTDASNGLHVAQILDGYVRRKVIKQTVMTTVYGVTRYGARLQIARQLKDIEDFPKEWVWPASTYLTTKTFDSLREMFTSAKEIQDWFTDCARFISSTCMQNVEWTTPLGLPVVQPYSRMEHRKTRSAHVGETMSLDMYEKPNVMKQKNAFPPNFIHSLDSSHMMLTSLFCERNEITFISVHDCFWTHACTVPDMNKICREQFVALHSQPILEDLSKFMINKYSFKESELNSENLVLNAAKQKLNQTLKQMPPKGDFDLQTVLKSTYFFS
ncbi:DNA-directed RNA polymerase, mitochondrial [Condylostylus longicornis]|uniref:DNA-directed RNA polymerase, mitochondrial n=1 Tax=Condylostylus longicornis TaxID=2530218 RepID=UPI00244E2B79|nr:DNA-directed RNA polymerase, mitochondrial [Condylostylus longicornis]